MTNDVRPRVHDSTPDDAETRAIRQIIADIETAFNTNDPALMNAHFAADASAVNAAGQRITGIDALDESASSGLNGFLRDQHVRYDVTDVTFLRPDVAIAHKLATATRANGEPIDVGHDMIAMYVLVKESGRWWVAARANTVVPRSE